ncbi:laccase precursor [Lasiosphaeria miniovina]|uniref:Laccase n=1 Tax=Lasiosphaeria miniovina TaxID=1954250 RepID=A0AA40BIB6_9PEZI|nr:laccase precursor [Lasiosphaeria miniovina]KAK0734746.1 laccase precursor [Lasiosphaeria miniovina]
MKPSILTLLAAAAGSHGLSIPAFDLQPRQSCDNTATSRSCWGDYSIDTNYYDETPDTGNTVEYWLSVEEGLCSPDGYQRTCMTFNGTVPGPTIFADWGDNLIIHVTNNMTVNGTAIHWHGLRQLNSTLHDGVPGVSQCPIAPGESFTYSFRVTQYGSTWYHSHFSLQYAEGLFGALTLNGPATADYDEDLGTLFLQDWSHIEAFTRWDSARQGPPPTLETGLINGTNTWTCATAGDANCVGSGAKFETVFEAGKKYRLRLINVAVEGVFQFSIDGHSLTVIGTDLVPIVPYTADSVQITIGQRYDVIVEASADAGDYWLRAGWVSACATNSNPDGMTGIVRYDSSSTADPTSTSNVTASTTCYDEPLASLVPHLALDVTNIPTITTEDLSFKVDTYFKWTVNTTSLLLDWANPTMLQVVSGEDVFPTDYNVVAVQPAGSAAEWAVLVIQDQAGLGLSHPIHLHGHDFWVLAQTTGVFNGSVDSFNTANPPRRDVATLPGNGYLALAFQLDNPGAWLCHCHIAWHASQGLSLEFVESQADIILADADQTVLNDTCSAWSTWDGTAVWPQDDSGI